MAKNIQRLLRRNFLMLLICLFSTGEINAQIKIKGTILDSATKESVPFASILLLNEDNLIAGTVASKDGEFLSLQ